MTDVRSVLTDHIWDVKEQECSCSGQSLGETHWHHQNVVLAQRVGKAEMALDRCRELFEEQHISAFSDDADALATTGQKVVDTTYLYGEGKKSIRDVESALAAWTVAHTAHKILKDKA